MIDLQQGASDVSNFDEDFTREPAVLTPIEDDVLATMDQELFKEFSYTNPNMTTWRHNAKLWLEIKRIEPKNA